MPTAYLDSPIGTLAITASDTGITAIQFLDAPPPDQPSNPPIIPPALQTCIDQLREYFAGQRQTFTVPLDMQGTEFQRRVWTELCAIPFGETRTYMQLAEIVGDPKAVRAVGTTNGRNPIAVIVPCHRVIGSDGSLTGYAGGLWRKEWLLTHEGRPTQQQLL
ncbi:MAG: methylated-DNA--[protein]-cysteine S-methyltransferase [Anaerolineae bacterium]|nr:methylated-DNA--[protein]-cysteine S-methyltransferase [Anaerolineae bacterium]